MMQNYRDLSGRYGLASRALLLALLTGPVQSHAQAILAHEVIEPRTFGYVIGDKIRREVDLTVNSDYRLDEASLPKAGRLDRWLELAAPEVLAKPARNGRRYHLILTYQLLNAPLALETVTIPQQNLRILGETQALTTWVPALRITVAPVTSTIAADRLTGASLQPDRPPVPLPTEARQNRLAGSAAALLILLLFAAWRRGLMAFIARKNLPFARAVRELKRLPPASDANAPQRASLKVVHQAINKAAGRAIFAHNLDDFLATHPEYAGLRNDFEQLFAVSGRVFFTDAAADAPSGSAPAALLRLCQHCRRIERRAFDVRAAAKLAVENHDVS
jgi:mxaA protein